MKKYVVTSVFVIGILAAIVITWHLRYVRNCRKGGSAELSRTERIKTSLPQHKDFNIVAYFVGRAEVRNKVIITALEAGTISSVDADDEAVVKKGTLLFTLGGVRIKACLASIEQKIKSLKQQVALAKNTLSRKQQAVEQKIALQDELNKAKADLAQLNARLKRAAGQLQLLNDVTYIRAPLSGVFTQRRVSTGQEVEKGTVLAEIIVPADIRIAATLFPQESAHLQGRTATIRSTNGQELSGIVTSVLPQRTSAGGTTVWIEGNDINRQLKAGETISGDILLATHKKTLALPEKAIVRDEQEKTYVFVKRAQGYTKQQVDTGVTSDGWVEILSGLTKADDVVTEGAYELFYQDFNKVYKVAD